MRDLYATEQMAGSPEEISNFISHLLHSNSASSSSPKLSNSPLVGFSHPPLRPAGAEASSSAGYRFEMSATHRPEICNFADFRSFMWKEKMELSKRVSSEDNDVEKGPDGPEIPADSVSHRSSSKRSRTAEIHNMSEKRRRSRINEKMKALQNLIPNSNKTDKASMLDEAIEYLKQLQLQVQMLTMRNGLSLHPTCAAGGVQPQMVGLSFEEGERMPGGYVSNEEKSEVLAMNRPAQCAISNDAVLLPGSPFGFEPMFAAHYGGPFASTSAKDVCREGSSRDHHQSATYRTMKPSSSSRVS